MRSLVQVQDSPAGGIAQLVERCLCTADVSGSSPLTSTPIIWLHNFSLSIQERKGFWGIPWHSEAMKGVSTNEMLRGAGRKL